MKRIVAIDSNNRECVHHCPDHRLEHALNHITINLSQTIVGEPEDEPDTTLDFSIQPHSEDYVDPPWIKRKAYYKKPIPPELSV